MAVLLVVLFHARIPWMEAGFLGVDVFFVISGYLITRSMLDESRRTGAVSLVDFWARRVRRLLASSLLVFSVTTPFALADAPRLGWSRVGLDLRGALLYFSNIRFSVKSEDYFANADGESYYLHSWSLSLEEQFYVVWPIAFGFFVWVSRRASIATWRVTVLGAACGVVSSLLTLYFMTKEGMAWAFFSLPSRAWELGLGAIGAALVEHGARPFCRWLAPIGAAMLIASLALVSDARPYPGLQAFLPAIGTVLLLVGGVGAQGFVQAFLGLRPLRSLGRVSYAWYLWHWPVFLWLGLRRENASITTVLSGILISAALAVLVTRFFEEPLRRGPLLRGRARPALLLAVSVALGAASPGIIALVDPARREPRLQLLQSASRDKVHLRGCEGWTEQVPASCDFGEKDAGASRTILLVGDSHAMHWIPALDALGIRHNVRVVYRGFSACPGVPLAILRKRVRFRACEVSHESLPEALALLRPALVLSASSAGHWTNIDVPARDAARERAWSDAIGRLDDAVRAARGRLVLLHDVPHWPFDPIRCLAEGESCAVFKPDWDRVPAVTRRVEEGVSRTRAIAVVDPRSAICAEDPCPPFDGRDEVKFWDAAHLTSRYSQRLEPFLSVALVSLFEAPVDGR